MRLIYDKPCNKLHKKPKYRQPILYRRDYAWEQTALPIGNGTIGLSVMGGYTCDTIYLNHKYLWSGGPSQARIDYNGGNVCLKDEFGKSVSDYYIKVRELFSCGKNEEASKLCEKLVGENNDGYGKYEPLGSVKINFEKKAKIASYCGELNLDNAVCGINTTFLDKTILRRKYFVSYPAKCAIICLTSENDDFTVTLNFSIKHDINYQSLDNGFTVQGVISDNGLRFAIAVRVITDGKLCVNNNCISLKNASNAKIFISCDTDYNDNYPIYRTGESETQLKSRIESLCDKTASSDFSKIYDEHVEDYKALYNANSLRIGQTSSLTTDKLIKLYKTRKLSDSSMRYLEQLLYAFGRYLTIATSRETDMLPSNLQGIWNISDSPAWHSDYHLNINLQMNYWPVFCANMTSCSMPLLRYIEALTKPGRVTAKIYTGANDGFMFHTQNTPFGWTCPGWEFGWGWSPSAVCWILHNLYEYYLFTLDKVVLRDKIYPLLKETSEYYGALLIKDDTGRLVACPASSPEHGPRTRGNTYEQTLHAQLFKDTIGAAIALGVDESLRKEWQKKLDLMRPFEIGEDGQIKEWFNETKLGCMGQKHHRHLSHLLGFFPCDLVDKERDTALISAAKISMNDRGDKSVGWAMGQRINTWARLGDGNKCLKLIGDFVSNGINLNLWDVHPPFQIDGNFGYTSAICEMIIDSHSGIIELLPALPAKWCDGEMIGMLARGGYTVDVIWSESYLVEAIITAKYDSTVTVKYDKLPLKCNLKSVQYGNKIVIYMLAGQKAHLTPNK